MNDLGCEPACDAAFQDGLLAIVGESERFATEGRNPTGLPILRCVDGRTAQKWESGEWVLRYVKEIVETMTFSWRDDDGEHFTNCLEDVPENAIPGVVISKVEIGDPYLYIERWRDPAFLERSGRYKSRFDETGKEIIRQQEQGCYDYYLRLERKDGSPHPADSEALMVIRTMWNYEHNTSLKERNKHVVEDRLRVWRDYPQWDDAIREASHQAN